MFKGKKILLGISGSIAAYKSATLTRLLVKAGAEVRIIMTPAAKNFITPLTLSVLSKNPVTSSFFTQQSGSWNNHVELARWADLLLIAPASANTISKLAGGICDNLLLAVWLSAPKTLPVYIAPAMDVDMFNHPVTQKNIRTLEALEIKIIPPEDGELASGLTGEGRMAEPEMIFHQLEAHFSTAKAIKGGALAGKIALVTAGPTYEAIDPVRYIGNHSSGKMGFAVARALAENGAEVKLVSGPVNINFIHANISRLDVSSAEEMYRTCMDNFRNADITVMCSAVSDYTPEYKATDKIKKTRRRKTLRLKPTKDILYELGKQKTEKQVLVGFALETVNESRNALKKLHGKNLDLIVMNSLKDEGAGFMKNTNKITLFDKHNRSIPFTLKSKDDVANDIVKHIVSLMKTKKYS